MDASLAEQVRTLHAVAPDEFVAARNGLTASLRRDGRRDDAATIAALRRPSWIDGALNRLAAERHAAVAGFVDAARTARRIQHADAEGRRTESLPDALRAVRSAQSKLASAGNDALVALGRRTDLAGVTARIGRAAAQPTELDLLAAGVLGLESPEVIAAFVTDHDDEDVDSAGSPAGDAIERDVDEAARHAIDAATRAVQLADKEAKVAATAARRATDRRDRAVAAVDAAEAAVRDAEAALERSRGELAEHESRAADTRRAADDAARAAADAAARLHELLD